VSTGRSVTGAITERNSVALTLDDGSRRQVDRVVLGTGFEIDIRRHPLISPEIAAQLDTRHGYPLLRSGFASSIPRLHFVGAYAADSFGPVARFVAGSTFTAAALMSVLAARPIRPGTHRRRVIVPTIKEEA
jgi:hypothetical protein